MKPLNKNPQKQRMNIELNQIRSILNDFRKTKYKCAQLIKAMEMEMPKGEYFKNIQKTTMRKMDLLDITGLVNLKNQLVRALTDLFQIERELRYKKQKFDARKQIMETQNQEIQSMHRNQFKSAIQSPYNKIPTFFEPNVRSIISEPKNQQPEVQQTKNKHKNLQIPLYRAKNQTNENKLDRISKYIASLKRNMKLNSETLGYKWKIKEFLLEDPNYVKLRSELQKFMMREEEVDNILSRAIEKGVKEYMKKAEIVDSNSEYKLIKIYKPSPKKNNNYKINEIFCNTGEVNMTLSSGTQLTRNIKRLAESPKTSKTFQKIELIQDRSFNSPKINRETEPLIISQPSKFQYTSPLRNLSSKIDIESKAEEDFNSIKKELQKSTESYIEMLSKINQTVEKGSQKLIQLREKRKKKFEKDDDIWDQLDNI